MTDHQKEQLASIMRSHFERDESNTDEYTMRHAAHMYIAGMLGALYNIQYQQLAEKYRSLPHTSNKRVYHDDIANVIVYLMDTPIKYNDNVLKKAYLDINTSQNRIEQTIGTLKPRTTGESKEHLLLKQLGNVLTYTKTFLEDAELVINHTIEKQNRIQY